MSKGEVQQLKLGLYKLYWKSGGYSLASVGFLHNGDRWFAPANWTSKKADGVATSYYRNWGWKSVEKAILIKSIE